MSDSGVSKDTKLACPKCGTEVGRRALLCPNCREPLTGASAPVEVKPAAQAPSPAAPTRQKPAAAARSVPRGVVSKGTSSSVTEEEGEPPLGRALTAKEEGTPLTRLLDRVQETVGKQARTESQRKKLKIAGVILGISFLLWMYVLVFRPSGLRAPDREREATSVLAAARAGDSAGPAAGGSGLATESADGSAASNETAVSTGSDNAATAEAGASGAKLRNPEAAETLITAAEQIERLARFLLTDAAPYAQPANPTSEEDLLPPIPSEIMAGPAASAAEKARYMEYLSRREDLLMDVVNNLAEARGLGISMERALATARLLREEAARLDSPPGEGRDLTNPSAHWAAPGGPLVEDEIRQVLTTLLSETDANEVIRIRKKI